MSAFVDLTGRTFGKLYVLKRVENYISPKGAILFRYLCECECGKETVVNGSSLASGDTKSCGCIAKNRLGNLNFVEMAGRKFGKLTVVRIDHRNTGRGVYWFCECDCGGTTVVEGGNLRSGHTKSCGCYHKERTVELYFKDLTGLKFGRLLAVNYFGKDNRGKSVWSCDCDCGNHVNVREDGLIGGTSTSCGCYNRDRVREATFKDLSGKRFGKLLVMKRIDDKEFPGGKKHVQYLCKCDCGNETRVLAGSLRNNLTTSCGCLSESNMVLNLKKYCYEKYDSVSEYRVVKNPKTNRWLPYDIYIPFKKIFIEIHGQQHYKSIAFFGGDEKLRETKYRDKIKKKFAQENGIYIEIDIRKISSTEKAISYIESFIN